MARILILTALSSFSRVGLVSATNEPIIVRQGEAIKVDDDLADELLAADKCNYDADDVPQPWFVEDAAATPLYDTTAPAVVPEPTTVLDNSELDSVAQTDIGNKAEKATAITTTAAKRTQRARAAT